MNKKIKILITAIVLRENFKTFSEWINRFLGVHRFVEYNNENSIYIEAEGSQEQLNKFIEWCKGQKKDIVNNIIIKTGTFKYL
ncbi:MAG: acylphosphatase [Bacteroidales bacterium]|nr:acylphosphatase [Bacteroidales bacterium]